jgi:hypothetical protein
LSDIYIRSFKVEERKEGSRKDEIINDRTEKCKGRKSNVGESMENIKTKRGKRIGRRNSRLKIRNRLIPSRN